MNLIDNIKDNFNKGFFDMAMSISCLPAQYPAWTIKGYYSVSVAVAVGKYFEFKETFEEIVIETMYDVVIAGQSYNMLVLTLNDTQYRDEFSTICSDFVDPGEDGEKRSKLVESPAEWWGRWRELLGNMAKLKNPYPVLGEMLTLNYLLSKGLQAEWTGGRGNTHDVELSDKTFEVKSTTQREGYKVKISSIYQMNPYDKKLSLVFCRFEQSPVGISVDDMVKKITEKGYPVDELEQTLSNQGLEKGRTSRSMKYNLLEMVSFDVDDDFPAITDKSFKGDRLPSNVVGISYVIDISSLKKSNLLLEYSPNV